MLLKTVRDKHKPVLLSLVNDFNDAFVILYLKGLLPELLTSEMSHNICMFMLRLHGR